MSETIYLEVLGSAVPDSTGELVPSESEWVAVDRCAVWIDATSDVLTVGEDQTVTRFSIAAPAGTEISADQRVRVRGRDLAIDGDPFDWSNFYSGRTPGMVFHTKWVS